MARSPLRIMGENGEKLHSGFSHNSREKGFWPLKKIGERYPEKREEVTGKGFPREKKLLLTAPFGERKKNHWGLYKKDKKNYPVDGIKKGTQQT